MLLIDSRSHAIETYLDSSWGAPPELPDRVLINPEDLPSAEENSCQSPIVAPASGSLAVQEYLRFNL
jgi:hypothetical protein